MKPREVEQALGLPPGPTIMALVAVAKKLARLHPSTAFERLGLSPPWLTTSGERKLQAQLPANMRLQTPDDYVATPAGVVPFETAGGGRHFGFLSTAGSSTDDCPIVRVEPGLPDSRTHVIAPTLLDFLGLVAACRSVHFTREDDDRELLTPPLAMRLHKAAMAEMDDRVQALRECIPGLVVPAQPSEVIRAAESPAFTLSIPLSDPRRAKLIPSNLAVAENGVQRARHALEVGAHARAIVHLEPSVAHESTRPRALALRVHAHLGTGARASAITDFERLLRAWLDDEPNGLAPHPRSVVLAREMLELLRSLELPDQAEAETQIRAAGPPPEADGDFF